MHNRVEYLESMLGAWKARVAPFNVNYRYVADELQYLLDDAGATAVVVQSAFAPTLAAVLPDLPRLRAIVQVADEQRSRPAARRASGTTTRCAAAPAGARRADVAPTTSTSSTPAARPGCPRACCGATATP